MKLIFTTYRKTHDELVLSYQLAGVQPPPPALVVRVGHQFRAHSLNVV